MVDSRKVCIACGISKNLNSFYTRGKYYYSNCKECTKNYNKKWHEKNKERMKKYYKKYSKRYDKSAIKECDNTSKDYKKVYNKNYQRNRKINDIRYKLACNLRVRLNIAIKNNQKAGSAVRDLGCSIEQFKAYLEGLWEEGMSWDNWSLNGWHIDHIIPLSYFDLTDNDQFLKACHYTNMQPLWAGENHRKFNHRN
jgi:hypothetical protein